MDEQTVNSLVSLSTTLRDLRDEAVKGRAESGIEAIWAAAEDAYLGIDDENRDESGTTRARWSKPTSMTGPVTSERTQSGNRSTVFIPLTARYVDAGHAKVCELLLPIDDKPFSFDPTPIPELVKARETMKSIMRGGMQTPPELNLDDLKQRIEVATKQAKDAEQQVSDWLIEAKFPNHMRKVIFDAARLGTGIIKGPIATESKATAVLRDSVGKIVLQTSRKIKPGVAVVSPWNLYPDPACGDDINNGDYIWEADDLTERRVRRLMDAPYYIRSEIDEVLKEGPQRCYLDENGQRVAQLADDPKNKKKLYRIWYFYGTIKKSDAENANLLSNKERAQAYAGDNDNAYVIATMINDRVVRVVPHPLVSAKFPYRVFPWRRRDGSWAGVGIGEQCDVAQRICNGGTRAMMTNAGQSAGVQFIIDNNAIVPADKQWVITPNKIWVRASQTPIDDISKAVTAVQIPDRQNSLMQIIEYSFRIAEESTNIPLISQGQSGPTTPDTYGAAALQNNNANQLLRNIGATCDDEITEPLITDFYEWLLLDPDVPSEMKGDLQINAHGSSALVERSIQNQIIQNLVEPSLNPAFELNPAKVMREYLKSQRIDPRSLGYTDEEKAENAKQPPPEAPVVTAAKIRAEGQIAVSKMRQDVDMKRLKHDVDRDTVFVMAETARTRGEFASRAQELTIRRELALVEYANKHQVSLDSIKGMLAKTAMTLRTQKELAGLKGPQVATPAIEPPGRAPNGEAFQR